MQQCDSANETIANRIREIEASPLISSLRELMRHADNLRGQEERAAAARQAFGIALAQLREAVEAYADAEQVAALIDTVRDTAQACVREGRRLHDHGTSVHGIVADLNQQLGEALGQSLA